VLAGRGLYVIGVDNDVTKVDAINDGRCYIREPGLGLMIRDAVSKGLLRATTDTVRAVKSSDAAIIAVPTPIKSGVIDFSYLKSALESVREGLHRGLLVVIESTVPPGTTVGFAKPLLEGSGLRVEEDFFLAHVPERIAPGRAVEELLSAPRVVGGVGPRSTEKAVELYSRVNPRLLPTDATTAEFVKLIENAYRDLNIAFANLLALIAERIGVDVYEAIRLANTHPRVNVHLPGAGVGGPCLTKDPYMLASLARDFWGSELILLARRLNDYMPLHVVELVERALGEEGVQLRGARVAVLGAAYKGGVDDTRESPSRRVVQELLGRGASVVVFDPYTGEAFGAERASSLEDAVRGADAVVIVTDHPEFRNLDLERLGELVRRRVIVDGRRVVEPHRAAERGFKYYGVGFGRAFRV
jgi:UDP-N-acetyl-D-mannosaminuronic acid dehydrogenase